VIDGVLERKIGEEQERFTIGLVMENT